MPQKTLSTDQQLDLLRPAILDYFSDHMAQVPVLSGHGSRVLAMADSVMNIDIKELVKLVRIDPACSVSLLRAANSAANRRGADVHGIDEAIVRLGRRDTYAVLAAAATRSLFEPKLSALRDLMPATWYALKHHAVVSAFLTGWLVNEHKVAPYEQGFVAGMFYDIGRMGVLYCLGSLMLREDFDFEISPPTVAQAMRLLQVDIGEAMLAHWQLPGWIANIASVRDDAPEVSPLARVTALVSSLNTLRDGTFVTDETTFDCDMWIEALRLSGAREMLGVQLQTFADRVTQVLEG